MNKRTNNKEKGITLVALVITIIVVLILASTTIRSLYGEYGLITKAKEAVEAYNHAEMREKEQMH